MADPIKDQSPNPGTPAGSDPSRADRRLNEMADRMAGRARGGELVNEDDGDLIIGKDDVIVENDAP